MDPFDLFQMFFSEGMGGNVRYEQRGGRIYRRHYQEETVDPRRRAARPANARNVMIMQLLPFIALMLFSVIPYLFTSVSGIINFVVY
jgi:hypothetical protein